MKPAGAQAVLQLCFNFTKKKKIGNTFINHPVDAPSSRKTVVSFTEVCAVRCYIKSLV